MSLVLNSHECIIINSIADDGVQRIVGGVVASSFSTVLALGYDLHISVSCRRHQQSLGTSNDQLFLCTLAGANSSPTFSGAWTYNVNGSYPTITDAYPRALIGCKQLVNYWEYTSNNFGLVSPDFTTTLSNQAVNELLTANTHLYVVAAAVSQVAGAPINCVVTLTFQPPLAFPTVMGVYDSTGHGLDVNIANTLPINCNVTNTTVAVSGSVRITDGTDTLQISSTGSIGVSVLNTAITVDGAVHITDGVDELKINTNGSLDVMVGNTSLAIAGAVRITDGVDELLVNSDGSINVDSSGGGSSGNVTIVGIADGLALPVNIVDGVNVAAVSKYGSLQTNNAGR